LFFLTVLASVSLFIMNLILAVIVEAAAEVKDQSLQELAQEKQREFNSAAAEFLELCVKLDTDGGGSLSKDELMEGFEHEEFAHTMRVLGLERDDMGILFEVIDQDFSGTVDYSEFVKMVFRMKQPDMHMMIWELAKIQQIVMKMCRNATEEMHRVEIAAESEMHRIADDEAHWHVPV
jgi:hypothetical protein